MSPSSSPPVLSEQDHWRVQAYGAKHPQSWVGMDHEGPTLIVMFTDPAPHEAAVRSLLPEGALVEFRAVARTASDLDRLRARLDRVLAEHPGTFHSCGTGVRTISLHLRSSAGALAERLHAGFGDALVIRLGAHEYPLDTSASPLPPEPGPVSTVSAPGLRVTPLPETTLGHRRGFPAGSRRAAQRGPVGGAAVDRPAGARLLLHPDGTVAGRTSGGMRGTGLMGRLGPGQSMQVRFFAGTDSRDPAVGPTLPPGEYLLVVVLRIHELNGVRPDDGRIVSSTTPVRVDAATR